MTQSAIGKHKTITWWQGKHTTNRKQSFFGYWS